MLGRDLEIQTISGQVELDPAPTPAAGKGAQMTNVHFLEDHIPWFGRFNGYEPLPRYLPPNVRHTVFSARPGLLPRLRGKWNSLKHGLGPAPQAQVDALQRFASSLADNPRAVGHILYGEHFVPFLKLLSDEALERTAITFHQPFDQWSEPGLAQLARVQHPVFLFTPRPNHFAPHLRQPLTFIPLGIDTEFFHPNAVVADEALTPRVLYSGVHLRNLDMLERVVGLLLQARGDLIIDMLVPLAHRNKPVFARLAKLDRLVWHAGLDAQQLRALYWQSAVMLLPMRDSGANTAVVEALACGLPVVTTDVGGIRDYGGGSVVSVVEPDDDLHMVETTLRILDHPARHRELSTASRQFAEHDLCWRRVVEQHIDVYSRVISPT